MQSRDHAYAYHEAPPCDLPDAGWTRVEIHDSAGLYPVARRVESAMKALDFPRKDSFAVGLVLREAVVNALRHGHRGDTTRAVLIGYHLSARAAFIEVADEGPGFNPYLVPDLFDDDGRGEGGRGRGLLLMRLYTNWIRFNKRGNRVILCKRRSDP